MKLFELDSTSKMQELISKLNEAADAYYNGREIMTDHEYDEMLEQLQQLENATGTILPNSPTVNVGASVKVDKLRKVTHEFPALSLDKTKDIDRVVDTFTVRGTVEDEVVVMWKLDGSTVQLTYDYGRLVLAATRGDGHIGQDITHNAKYIGGIPLTVPDVSRFTVRGEAVISFEDFEKINADLPDNEKFKNPRNLAAASITMLDPEDMKDRHVQFRAFELVDHPDMRNERSILSQSFWHRLIFCEDQGFSAVVNYLESVHPDGALDNLREDLEMSEQRLYTLPVDGLVVAYEDVNYTDGLKGTEHHPNVLKGYAFKWKDEVAVTTLRDIEWSPSRTGLLNPVAVFDSVELEGTTVSRASLHNFSIMEKLHLHLGDSVEVIKANKIIPQVIANKSDSELYTDLTFDKFEVICPACGQRGVLRTSKDGVQSVYCDNPTCSAKLVYKFEHFCERTSMNVEGLSEATIERFVKAGYLEKFSDIYNLNMFKDEITELDGFGEKSWENLWEAIQTSRDTNLVRLLVGIGIPSIGISQAKSLAKHFGGDAKAFLQAKSNDFSQIEGIGQVAGENISRWLNDSENWAEVFDLLNFLNFESTTEEKCSQTLSGLVFVVTGSVSHYKNRKELESVIEAHGGRVASSVTSKTSYLINNDTASTSSKNKKAKELGIPIIDESSFEQLVYTS